MSRYGRRRRRSFGRSRFAGKYRTRAGRRIHSYRRLSRGGIRM